MTTERTRVLISTPFLPTEADLSKARTLAMFLFDRGCLPIMPFIYQQLFQPSEAEYYLVCAELFKQVNEVFSIGVLSEELGLLFAAKGVTPRVV